MSKVAIIGAKGLIGRHLAWYLEEKKGLQVEGAINAAFSKFYADANIELFVNY